MNYFKRLETIFIAIVILVLGVAYGLMSRKDYSVRSPEPQAQQQPAGEQSGQPGGSTEPTSLPENVLARYEGQEGKTALELLKASYRVETKSFGDLGEFVTSIDGKTADSRHFWAFYVNGVPAQVGAGSYVTKPGEMIDWKYEEIN